MNQPTLERKAAKLVKAVRDGAVGVLKLAKCEELLRKKVYQVEGSEVAELQEKKRTLDEADSKKQAWVDAMCELVPKIESLRISLLPIGSSLEKFREELKQLPFWVPTLEPGAFSSDRSTVVKGLTILLQVCEALLASLVKPIKSKRGKSYCSPVDDERHKRITDKNPGAFNEYSNSALWKQHHYQEQKLKPELKKRGFCRSMDRIRKKYRYIPSSKAENK